MDPESQKKIDQLRFDYRLRQFFRYRWKQLVCQHRKTFDDIGWTSHAIKCSNCYLTLSSKRHNEEERKHYTRPSVRKMFHWIKTGEWTGE